MSKKKQKVCLLIGLTIAIVTVTGAIVAGQVQDDLHDEETTIRIQESTTTASNSLVNLSSNLSQNDPNNGMEDTPIWPVVTGGIPNSFVDHHHSSSENRIVSTSTINNDEDQLAIESNASQSSIDQLSNGNDRDDNDDNDDNHMIEPINDNTNDSSNDQPHIAWLNSSVISEICALPLGFARESRLVSIHLSGCSRYDVKSLLSALALDEVVHTRHCERLLQELAQLDLIIGEFDQQFEKIITRYNCHNGYSVKWNCHDCKKAYKDWLCAVNLPHFIDGVRVKPCISFCERVEQRCPYLHPITREQYGGQPVFICIDPNIPFVPSITPSIAYSDAPKCYDLCHIRHDASELVNDTLAKYLPPSSPSSSSSSSATSAHSIHGQLTVNDKTNARLKCPQKDALAQEVLAEQQAMASQAQRAQHHTSSNSNSNANSNSHNSNNDQFDNEPDEQERAELQIVQQQQQQLQLYEQHQRLKMLQHHLQAHKQQKHHDHR